MVVFLPVTVGVSVADMFSCEGAVFVAEHDYLGIDGGWMREKVGGGGTLWGGICRGDGEQECGGSAKGENCIAGRGEGDDGGRVVPREWGDDALWKLMRTGVSVGGGRLTRTESPSENPPV